jgi:hypothetical protein
LAISYIVSDRYINVSVSGPQSRGFKYLGPPLRISGAQPLTLTGRKGAGGIKTNMAREYGDGRLKFGKPGDATIATFIEKANGSALLEVSKTGITVPGALTFASVASDGFLMNTNEKIEFRDAGIFIHSSADGKLLISSDGVGADDITLTGTVTFSDDVTGLTSSVTDGGHTHVAFSPINMGGITGVLGAATLYVGGAFLAAGGSGAETICFVAPCAGTISKLYTVLGTAPGGADTVISTVRVAGADSTVTCTISAAAVAANDVAHSVAVAAGDKITVKVVSGAGTAANYAASIQFNATAGAVSNTTGVTVATV